VGGADRAGRLVRGKLTLAFPTVRIMGMPVYEYACLDCRHRFDALRPMKDADAPIPCGECGSLHVSRTLSVFFAQSDGRSVAGSQSGCAACGGGHCASCAN
jgi:putative FmdB family regulatory protein